MISLVMMVVVDNKSRTENSDNIALYVAEFDARIVAYLLNGRLSTDMDDFFADDEAAETAVAPVVEAKEDEESGKSASEISRDLLAALSNRALKRPVEDSVQVGDDETTRVAKIQKLMIPPEDVKEEESIEEILPEAPQVVEDVENDASRVRIVVQTIETGSDNCIHEVAIPKDLPHVELQDSKQGPAKSYPFTLDPFQREAIKCIDNNQSVLVSAHTSAGKTVVASYSIAKALRDKQRVVYTSPIKALSNQKFRELAEEFTDVGLMTGDVTLNPDASCLVMTTEILRSMLYRGSEIMREVGWVIFDEIHYMRDKERGVVWEETLILLPDSVHYAFLSATIPNALQFAQWITYLHRQPVHVVYTEYRPTPLQHFIYPAGGRGLYEVVNVKGQFREDKFVEAMGCLNAPTENDGRGRKSGKGASSVVKIIHTIREKALLPCIVFSFSRADCKAYADQLRDVDFNTEEEKKIVTEIFANAVDLLTEDDRNLPQINEILPLIQRGIGVHHSGLIPILKETIEILFGEGLLKILFATETFAMGLNMPARTVVFTSARKFDGTDYRWISSGEYIQMSGRAGRRGKDDRGLVILMVDQQMGSDVAKQVIKGKTDPLDSQFRLTYNMVLNLLRVEGINPEFMLERSFYQFQNYSQIPDLKKRVELAKKRVDGTFIHDEKPYMAFYTMEQQLQEKTNEIQKIVMQPKNSVPFFKPGRVLLIKTESLDYGYSVLVGFNKKPNPDDPSQIVYIVEVALFVSTDVERSGFSRQKSVRLSDLVPMDWNSGREAFVAVVNVTLDCVREMSSVCLRFPDDLTTVDGRKSLVRIMRESRKRLNGRFPPLHPVKDMKIKDEELVKLVDEEKSLGHRVENHELKKRKDFKEMMEKLKNKLNLIRAHEAAVKTLNDAKQVLQKGELICRKRILRRLQYCDESDVITHKGRVACEIGAADELVLTEMLFAGVFNSMTPPEVAAMLSCFVFQEKSKNQVPENLQGHFRTLQETARRIAKVSAECKLQFNEEQYLESFNPGLMTVVEAWCSGKSFNEVVNLSNNIFEGSIIRCMRRLEELLREMRDASATMGNEELKKHFEEAREALRRDIVFAASLYL
ncbi:hypothetical protein QR680_016005 [Steinernema hermaphroditum]|uniref:Superkiller viralicidic activity 2-like 2 n=1 Tax=Steinernema hermaphroditum TaxID=289476 RepID=A0AA39H9Q2_9BILA|nr:hypothetical protein QR680_016005 [Steinernema hermaphroditum]